jgi:hypothetical protein
MVQSGFDPGRGRSSLQSVLGSEVLRALGVKLKQLWSGHVDGTPAGVLTFLRPISSNAVIWTIRCAVELNSRAGALHERLISAVGRLSRNVIQFRNQSEFRMLAKDGLDNRPVFFGLDAAR